MFNLAIRIQYVHLHCNIISTFRLSFNHFQIQTALTFQNESDDHAAQHRESGLEVGHDFVFVPLHPSHEFFAQLLRLGTQGGAKFQQRSAAIFEVRSNFDLANGIRLLQFREMIMQFQPYFNLTIAFFLLTLRLVLTHPRSVTNFRTEGQEALGQSMGGQSSLQA